MRGGAPVAEAVPSGYFRGSNPGQASTGTRGYFG